MTRDLLIFDLNGVLIDSKHQSEYKRVFHPKRHDFSTDKNLYVFVRPHARAFLEFAFEHFDVGFWSSMTMENTYDILVRLLTVPQVNAVKIVLTQEDCSMLGEYVENTKKPLFYKVLDRLWTKAEMRPYRDHVLLIDDSPHKLTFNPLHTAIHPTTYTVLHLEPDDTELLRLQSYLQSYLECSLTTTSLRTYVRDTPYDEGFQTEPKTERPISNEEEGGCHDDEGSPVSRRVWSRVSAWWRSLYLLWCARCD